MPTSTVLAVAPAPLFQRLARWLPDAALVHASTAEEAASLLGATAFDLAVLAEAGGASLDLVRQAAGQGSAVVFVATLDAETAAAALRLGARCVPPGQDGLLEATVLHTSETAGDAGAAAGGQLRDLAQRLSQIYHDLNNPLAIISGNAQFYRELAGAMGVGEELVSPVADIEEAADRMAALTERIRALKQELLARVEAEGGSGGANP